MWNRDYLKVYPFQLTTLSPVHIGSGGQVAFDILEQSASDQDVYGLTDIHSLFQDQFSEDADWESFVEEVNQLTSELEADYTVQEKYWTRKVRLAEFPDDPHFGEVSFREFNHYKTEQGDVLYLPGTSMKGSIRTALLTYLLKSFYFVGSASNRPARGKRDFVRNYQPALDDRFSGPKDRKIARAQQDLGRLFRVRDVSFPSQMSEIRLSVGRNWKQNFWSDRTRGRKMENWLECLPSGIQAPEPLEIAIDRRLPELARQSKGLARISQEGQKLSDIQTILDLINEHTLNLLRRECNFLRANHLDDELIKEYARHLEILKDLIIQNNSSEFCILRLGYGIGFTFITGGWQFKKKPSFRGSSELNALKNSVRRGYYKGPVPFPKTRKMLADGSPLGFVKLELQKDE